jgi:hypothetical protein
LATLITMFLRDTAYCCPLRLSLERLVYRPLCPVSGFPGCPGWSLLHRLLRVRCPCCIIGDLSAYPIRGDASGSGVARTARSPSALGALPIPLLLASQAGKHILMNEESMGLHLYYHHRWGRVVLEHWKLVPEFASTTPLVTCLSRALDGRHPKSLSAGWFHDYLDTQVRQ